MLDVVWAQMAADVLAIGMTLVSQLRAHCAPMLQPPLSKTLERVECREWCARLRGAQEAGSYVNETTWTPNAVDDMT